MRAPPLMMGAALLFWGWQADLLFWSGLMAVIIEASHLVRARWELSRADLNRIWDLCALLVLGAALLAYTSQDRIHMALKFFQWLPVAFFPLLVAQVYGTFDAIPMSVFSWVLRRHFTGTLANKSFNISLPFFAGCLISASAGNQPSPWFYPGIVALMVWALFLVRPARVSPARWIVVVALIATVGDFGHRQLQSLQPQVEGALARWIYRLIRRPPDLRETRTAIGQIGQIKLSGKIVFRLELISGHVPDRLRDASYDLYTRGIWRATDSAFSPVYVDANDTAMLLPQNDPASAIRISTYLQNQRGLLTVPPGTFKLQDFPALLETNRFGSGRIQEGPGLLQMAAWFGPGKTSDGPPGEMDLAVPEDERTALQQVLKPMALEGKTEREKVDAIRRFFAQQFGYTLYITQNHIDPAGTNSALGQFLLKTHAGHCEYFATATVLLLRELGIPARYVTGYAVTEMARRGKTYLVRERHAHAWALVYFKDLGWVDIDTTPSSWDEAENARASKWERLSDLWSEFFLLFSKWRWSKESYTAYLSWALAALIVLLAWRIFFTRRRKRRVTNLAEQAEREWPGKESEFYELVDYLTRIGIGREPHEPLRSWEARLLAGRPGDDRLRLIFRLHRRLRFDPRGLPPNERLLLKQEVKHWISEFPGQTKRQ